MGYNLFLDDVRQPMDCLNYMEKRIGNAVSMYASLNWEIVRNYDQFVKYVTEHGVPDLVSFDHDLAEAHYHETMYEGGKVYMQYLETVSEKTGKHCAVWLSEYCQDNGKEFPKWVVHSMNPAGTESIQSFILSYLKHVEGKN